MNASWWSKRSPGVKAALTVAVVVVVLEVLSDLLPAAGYIIVLPFALVAYYVQGLLVGWYIQNDPRRASAGPGAYLWAGAVSAFWTGVVLSNLVSLVDTLLLTAATLGAVLLGLPLMLVATLVDMALNFLVTMLAAWLYSRYSGRRLAAISCALLAAALVCLCLAVAALAGALAVGGVGLLRRLPGVTATPTP